ncbi:MAG: hypothetical protein JSR54_02630 [Proteobacteria bacterium]|nr:hypothetical protein [Pseudomonadota bacterium]
MVLIAARCALLLGVAAAAWLAGAWVGHRTGLPWLRVGVTAVILCLPAWDVLPGYIAYRSAIQAHGGWHLYRVAAAEGYLDLREDTDIGVWSRLTGSSFRYIEIWSRRRPLSSEIDPAYYELSLAPPGSAGCGDGPLPQNVKVLQEGEGLGASCPAVQRHDAPISEFVVRSSAGWEDLPRSAWLRPLEEKWTRVEERSGRSTLAETVVLRYRPWISTLGFGDLIPPFVSAAVTGRSVPLNLAAVLKPGPAP